MFLKKVPAAYVVSRTVQSCDISEINNVSIDYCAFINVSIL